MPFEIFVSARFIYLIFRHLVIRAPTCPSLTHSLARLIATNVGVIWLHIKVIASCDSLAPQRFKSVNFVHLIVSTAIVLALIGLYISPNSEGSPIGRIRLNGFFFKIDKFKAVMTFVLSSLSIMLLSKPKLDSDKSNVVKFFAKNMAMAMMELIPRYDCSPRYVILGS